MSKRILAAMFAVVISAGLAWSQDADKVLLRYKWQIGEQAKWVVNSEGTGTVVTQDLMKAPPEETVTSISSTSTMPMYQTVEAVDEEGNGTISYQMGIIEVDWEAADGTVQHIVMDPVAKTMTVNGETTPAPPTAMLFGDEPIRMVLSPRGRVLESTMPAAMEQLFGTGGLSPTHAFDMMQSQQMEFPEQPIGVGYTWTQTSAITTSAPPGEAEQGAGDPEPPPFSFTAAYTLMGFETVAGVECAQIEAVGALDMTEAFQITQSTEQVDLTIAAGPSHVSLRGFVYFDPAAGRMVKTEMDIIMNMRQHVQGEMKTPEGTQGLDMESISDPMRMHTVVMLKLE
jgi:hypothetical protein